MNTKLLICATLVCLSSFSACKPSEEKQTGQTSEKKEDKQIQPPDVVVKGFLDTYIVKRDLKEAYKYFSQADQKAKSEAQYTKEKGQYGLADVLSGMSSYEIKKSEIFPDKATFSIEIKTVDIEKVIKEVMAKRTIGELASMKEADMMKWTIKKLEEDKKSKTPIPMTTQPETVQMILESDKWSVFVDWAGKPNTGQDTKSTLKIGEQGPLLSTPEKGDVVLKVNSVKFNAKKAGAGMVHCIVNVTLTNKMKGQFTENFVTPLSGSEIFADGGNKYKREFIIYDPELATDINVLDPLNPGKALTGDLVFKVDKTAKNLILKFDAGYSPLPQSTDYSEGKSLSFKLGDVSL